MKNMPITEANYAGAWESLEARYGNKRMLSSFHMSSLTNLLPIKEQSSAGIKRVIDFFQQYIRSFLSLNKPVTELDEWFYFLMLQKLDSVTRLNWETSLQDSSNIPKYADLTKFLESRQQA